MSVFNQSRQTVIRLIFLAVFVILIARLFVLQLLSPQYGIQAVDNAVDRKTIYPDRGLIFDRKGKPILENTVTHDLMILPNQLKGIDTLGLCQALGIDTTEFRQRLVTSIIRNGRYRPSVFEASLPMDKFVKLQENIYRFEPGFYLQDRPIRSYPYRAAEHVLGDRDRNEWACLANRTPAQSDRYSPAVLRIYPVAVRLQTQKACNGRS